MMAHACDFEASPSSAAGVSKRNGRTFDPTSVIQLAAAGAVVVFVWLTMSSCSVCMADTELADSELYS
jgi:hypothetical protein